MDIADLAGIGPKSAERLNAVGVETFEQLDELGSVGAYLLLKDAFPKWTTLNALWGMHAALMEIDWRELPVEIKDQLLAEVEESAS
jgi:DNA transformation protein and related proteins